LRFQNTDTKLPSGSWINRRQRRQKANAHVQSCCLYSVNEANKPAANRVHHNNDKCPPGRDIPSWERKQGTGGYRLCHDCENLNAQGR
jgi:hypothetical protein